MPPSLRPSAPERARRAARDHAARVVHRQPGRGGHLRPEPERGLPVPQRLCAHRRR